MSNSWLTPATSTKTSDITDFTLICCSRSQASGKSEWQTGDGRMGVCVTCAFRLLFHRNSRVSEETTDFCACQRRIGKKTRNTKKKRDDSTPLKDKAEILEATAARFSHMSNLRSPPTFLSASLEWGFSITSVRKALDKHSCTCENSLKIPLPHSPGTSSPHPGLTHSNTQTLRNTPNKTRDSFLGNSYQGN